MEIVNLGACGKAVVFKIDSKMYALTDSYTLIMIDSIDDLHNEDEVGVLIDSL